MGAIQERPFIYGRRQSGKRFLIEFLLFVATVPLSDPLPSLGAIVQRGFRLSLSGQNRGESNIELMPIFGGAWNSQVSLLHRECQILVISIQIPFCFVTIPSLFHPLLGVSGAHRREVFKFHPWLHSGESVGAIVQSILLRGHESQEVVGRIFFL